MAVFAPQIITPEGDEQFDLGTVTITWSISDPPTTMLPPESTVLSDMVYEIGYTDNYVGEKTNWHTLDARIPGGQSSFTWNVGKMIKSDSVRIRMRALSFDLQETSDYSISAVFSINVFKLTPPAIVSPIPNTLYTDFILIILDETLVKNTYNQKVRYTLEYSSHVRSVDWTIIRANLPVGQNVVRWNIEDLLPAEDYVLRLTTRNVSTCDGATADTPDQSSTRFVYNIIVQQSGMFIIDTKPPEAVLQIENNLGVTNQLEQVVSIFASDETTEVTQIQLRECDASSQLALGDLEDPYDPTGGCTPIEELLGGANVDFGRLIGKPVSSSTKITWKFDDTSGLKKLEALLTDSGGNTSIQLDSNVFLSTFISDSRIADFIIVVEQRDKVTIDETTSPPNIVIESATFEVVYFGTASGEFWALEPFARLMFSLTAGQEILLLFEFNSAEFIFAYSPALDLGYAYRNDVSTATLLNTFTTGLSVTKGLAVFSSSLFIGMENGELWQYNGFTFTLLTAFDDPINTLHGDLEYLYVGFENSSEMVLYNGTVFITLDLE